MNRLRAIRKKHALRVRQMRDGAFGFYVEDVPEGQEHQALVILGDLAFRVGVDSVMSGRVAWRPRGNRMLLSFRDGTSEALKRMGGDGWRSRQGRTYRMKHDDPGHP